MKKSAYDRVMALKVSEIAEYLKKMECDLQITKLARDVAETKLKAVGDLLLKAKVISKKDVAAKGLEKAVRDKFFAK